MAEITQTAILDVQTSQSVKSVKDLKNQIKDLKDKIVELNAAGEDTTKETTQLGNAMRQLKDLNEDAKRSSTDLGDQLSTAAGAMKGMAGAVSAVTGVMGLMGVESEKSTKLLKVMASAMAITAGIQGMEAGAKALKALVGGLAAATKGAKTLGGALKAAFSSNPIGLIITAVVTLITVMKSLTDESEELAEAQQEAADKVKKRWEDAANAVNDGFENLRNTASIDPNSILDEDEWEKYMEKVGDDAKGVYIKAEIEAKKYRDYIAKQLAENPNYKYTEESKKIYREYYEQLKIYAAAYYKYTEKQAWVASAKSGEAWGEARKAMAKTKDEYAKTVKEEQDLDKEREKQRKTNAENAAKAAKDNATKLLNIEKKRIEEELKLAQARSKRLYDLDVETATKKLQNGEITEKEYNDMLLQLDTQYYTTAQNQLQKFIDSMGALKEKYKDNKLISEEDLNNILPESVLENYLQQIDDARRALQNAVQENKTNTLEKEFAAKELQAETEKQNALNEITRDGFLQRYEIEKKYLSDSLLAFNDYIGQEKELINLELENETTRYNTISENLKSQMQMMQEKKDAGLITETEYNEGMAQLNQENFDNEQEHTEKIIELEQRKREVKKQTLEAATEIEKAAANASVEILNGLADYLGENNESYKGLKIAAALIDTIQGAISAFTAAQSIPPPYGQIVGAVNAAAVTAMGMMNIAKIKQINPKGENGGTSATPASSSVQTFTTPTTATIATGATNDFTNMMGEAVENANQNNKVYVVLNDINEAESRRVSVTNSNTF